MSDEPREPLSELDAALGEDRPERSEEGERRGGAPEEGPSAPDPLDPVEEEEGEGAAVEEEGEPAGHEDGRAGRLRRLFGRARGWALPALAVALALTAGLFAFLWQREANENAARDQVREVAERFTQNLVTFDYRTLDSDIERIREDATGSFQGELDVAFGGDIDAFREALREARAQSSGSVLGSVVQSLEADTARILVIADQRIQNQETPEPRDIPRRIELTLVETSEGWKVDRVDASGGLTGGG